jgi:anthranilate synthase component II
MILLIDNYDSFTWNLVQAFWRLGAEVKVVMNDGITLDAIASLKPRGIVVSPGPCSPNEAGISVSAIKRFASSTPILGVCLGHQAIGAAFGGDVVRAPVPMHGKISHIAHDDSGVFEGLSHPFLATRYHSLVVSRETLPETLHVCAWNEGAEHTGLVMGMQLRGRPVFGVQFHPESIMTREGPLLLENFVRVVNA